MPFYTQAVIGLALTVFAARAEVAPAALCGNGTNDVLIERAFIPSPRNRHGEVRLIRRGDAHGVQVLLYSDQLKRGLKAIRNRELASWRLGAAHHDDSTRYLALLKKSEATILAALPSPPDSTVAPAKMLIEFISVGEQGVVAFYEPQLGGDADHIEILAARLLAYMDASPDYVNRAMDIIMQSAFHPESDAEGP